MNQFSQILLLADIEGFFGIVFFLIAFVGWVINLVNQNQEQQKRPRPPQKPGQRTQKNVQNEIDQFLSQSRQKQQRGNRPQDTDDVEVIAPPPPRRAPPKRRKTREEVWEEQTGNAPPIRPQQRPSRNPAKSKGRGLAARHLDSKQKKSEKPRTSQRKASIAEQVENDLPHAINEHVTSRLHSFSAEDPKSTGQSGISSTTTNRKTKGSAIGQLLKSKAGIRNAILLQEILSPPKSLRNKQ